MPHYLIDNEVPSSALAVAEALTNDTGIALPTVSLSLAAEVNRAALTAMVQSSQELGEHIAQLETQYDQFVEDRQRITAAVEDLPTADEIGKAAEEFLRGLGGQEPEA